MKKIKLIANDILGIAPQITNYLIDSFKQLKLSKNELNEKRETGGVQDVVLEIDHFIGKVYIEKIYNKYRQDLTIDSEEEEERTGNGPIILRFDPLDGSKHAKEGIPLIASTASLVKNGKTLFSIVINPFTGEIYHAFKNGGAYLNGKKITVSNAGIRDDLSFVMYEAPNSQIFNKEPKEFNAFASQLQKLQKKTYRMRNIGLSTLSVCWVADGSCPAFIDFSGTTKLYDIEAPALIAKEAGALIGNIKGKIKDKIDHNQNDNKKHILENLVIANPSSFSEIQKILSEHL